MKRVLFFILIFAGTAHAQTIVNGKTGILGTTVVYGIPPSGSVLEGNTLMMGGTLLDYRSAPGAQIFAIYPPAYGTTNYSHFVANVLTNTSIDGVNIPITWSKIEPSSTGTPGSYPPMTDSSVQCHPYSVDTDTCVKDAMGFFHSYSWDYYEQMGCGSAQNIQVWFGLCSEYTRKTIVNLYFIGIDDGMTNSSTPEYVTDPFYVGQFTSNPVQDVMNAYNQTACALQQWTGYTNVTLTASLGSVVGSPLPNSNWQQNDTIWVTAPFSSSCTTGAAGVQLSGVTGSSFTFPNMTGCITGVGGVAATAVIGASDSFAVPYELPYMTAYRAALTALFLHFGSTYTLAPATSLASQLGYIRFGHSVGGEAYPYCPSYMYGLTEGYNLGGMGPWPCNWTGYTGVTAFQCSLSGSSPGYYGGNLQWAQSKAPYMKIYAPLNQYGGGSTTANWYGQREAEQAVMYNAGFGSQGMSLADTGVLNGCANAVSYWCNAFQMYYGKGLPLELQQAGLSDPLDNTCQPPLSTGSGGCAAAPQGDSGDLRYWLPFDIANHANVIELFYLDAALAFDKNYCTVFSTVDGITCTVGYDVTTSYPYITKTLQGEFFNLVGQGARCPPGMGGGIGQGGCSYAIAINAAHLTH